MSKRLDYNQRAGLEAFGGIHDYIAQNSRPARLVDLVYLAVPQIRNCAYCLDTHTRDLLRKGQSVEKLAAGLVSEVTSALGSCPWPLA